MNPITVEVLLKPAPELENLIRAMLGVVPAGTQVLTAASPAPAAQPVTEPATPVQPVPVAAVPVAPSGPAAPAQPVPAAAVPTTERTYTLEELGRAGAQLLDAGKGAEATALLAQFSIQAITDLKPEQYGTFATELRKLGAKI